MSIRDVVFVVGMGRSGTSALTRTLSLCGWAMPEALVAAKSVNPKGSWEPIECWRLNDSFLIRHGTISYDPTMQMTVDEKARQQFTQEISAFLSRCPHAPVLLIKDPNISVLLDFWIAGAKLAGFTPKVVIALRHPSEVIASWKGINPELTSARWLKFTLLAERNSRGEKRVVVEFTNLLADWRKQVARVSTSLGIDVLPNEAEVERFLTAELYRNRHQGPVTEAFAEGWISRVYALMASAARDGAIAERELDSILEGYRLSERTFRLSWDAFRAEVAATDVKACMRDLDHVVLLQRGTDF